MKHRDNSPFHHTLSLCASLALKINGNIHTPCIVHGVWKDAQGWCGLNDTHCVLLLSARYFFAFVSTSFLLISLYLIWSPEIENCLRDTKIKFGHAEILSVTAVFTTCADPFVSLIGGDHAVGINGLASWKMGAIWSGPGRSGSGLQWAETCHLPTHATAWSFYHLALTRSMIPGLCRCETQWIGTGARIHRQGFKPVKVFFLFSVKPVYNRISYWFLSQLV